MIDHQRHRGVFVFLALFAAVALLGACGNSNKKSTSPAETVSLNAATTVGMSVCTTCHTAVTTDWLTSKHANAGNGLNSSGSPTIGGNYTPGSCGRCHDPNGDSANIIAAGTIGGIARPVVGCEACHGPGSLHANAGGSGVISRFSGTFASTSIGPTTVSGQFIMCTNCHELLDSSGTTTNPNPAHLATAPTGTPFFITDTHFATPGSWPAPDYKSNTYITGYAMNYADDRVCTTCHNPHKSASQNREWAQSAHADKNPINLNSTTPPSGYFSGAWAHYNWSCDGSSTNGCASSLSSSSRMACQRCHTTSGFTAYADALRTGDIQRASDIRNGLVALVTYASNWKPEMLECNGCHTDNKGNLRNPGAVTANYDYVSGGNTYAKASHIYPDLQGSNVCMACHTGRESGDTIRGLNDPALLSSQTISAYNFSNTGFVNSHYLTAGGQVFTVTGYEFPGRPYNNLTEYRHDKIGTPATLELSPHVDTGSNGPCIGCHMSRPNKNGNHLFLPVSRSTTTIGLITGIASELCFKCHGPSTTLILDLVREQKAQFVESIEALKDRLAARGIYFAPYNPYFFIGPGFDPGYSEATASPHCQPSNVPVRNWQTGGTSTFVYVSGTSCTSSVLVAGDAGTGQNNMGAAFNFNLLEHDPGAYVHNRMYTKRLIYDSIDWIDDNVMNYSVGDTLDAACSVGSPPAWCAEAMTYLLPNGVLGIEAERP
jgi:hypothetical protein